MNEEEKKKKADSRFTAGNEWAWEILLGQKAMKTSKTNRDNVKRHNPTATFSYCANTG